MIGTELAQANGCIGGSMKKITESRDGIPRLDLSIKYRLGAYDMAVHIINRIKYGKEMDTTPKDHETCEMRDERIENAVKDFMAGKNSKEILEIVSDSIDNDGTNSPYYSVSDEGYDKAVDFLTGYLKRRYKGFQK